MGCLTCDCDEVGAHLEVFAHAHFAEQMPSLWNLDQATLDKLCRRKSGDIVTPKFDAAALHRGEAGNRAHQGGLAGAIGAKQANDLPLSDFEADVAHHGNAAIACTEAGQTQRHAASPR